MTQVFWIFRHQIIAKDIFFNYPTLLIFDALTINSSNISYKMSTSLEHEHDTDRLAKLKFT